MCNRPNRLEKSLVIVVYHFNSVVGDIILCYNFKQCFRERTIVS